MVNAFASWSLYRVGGIILRVYTERPAFHICLAARCAWVS